MHGDGLKAHSAKEAIVEAYERGEGDEFIQPTVLGEHPGIPSNEPVLIFNFRSDRARQLAAAVGLEECTTFDRAGVGSRRLYCMTEYDAEYPFEVLFPPQVPEQVLSEIISDVGMRQLHCAETEKYPHVTYFFNGGREPPHPGEDRIIVPSPTVATYDLQPEMSAAKVADELISAIHGDKYH